MARIKAGNVAGPRQPISGRVQALRSSSARGARAGLGQPPRGARPGYLFASSACFAPPSPWDPLFEGVRAGVRDCTCPALALARLSASVGPLSARPSFRNHHALASLAAAAARPSLLRAGLLSSSGLTRNGCLDSTTELLGLRD